MSAAVHESYNSLHGFNYSGCCRRTKRSTLFTTRIVCFREFRFLALHRKGQKRYFAPQLAQTRSASLPFSCLDGRGWSWASAWFAASSASRCKWPPQQEPKGCKFWASLPRSVFQQPPTKKGVATNRTLNSFHAMEARNFEHHQRVEFWSVPNRCT